MEYYYNDDGEIGILVSHGFGAGWSTWNQKELAYDKRVVEYYLAHKNDREWMKAIDSYSDNPILRRAKEYFKTLGYEGVYFGGFNRLELEFVPKGVPFRIDEYGGAESLVIGTDEFTVLY